MSESQNVEERYSGLVQYWKLDFKHLWAFPYQAFMTQLTLHKNLDSRFVKQKEDLGWLRRAIQDL